MRVLFVGASLLLAAGAAWVYISASGSAEVVAGAEGIAPEVDDYGEPEPELSWFDWGSYNDLFDGVTGLVETMEESSAALDYFEPSEFGRWWPLMDSDLLKKLDKFRELWGRAVVISPAAGALGRYAGDSGSYHNIDKWGAVRAVDVFPRGLTTANAAGAVAAAEAAGFGGIGVYTDTMPSMMIHLDNRSGRGRWSRINKKYGAIENAYS